MSAYEKRDERFRCWWCTDGDGFETRKEAESHAEFVGCYVMGYGWWENVEAARVPPSALAAKRTDEERTFG